MDTQTVSDPPTPQPAVAVEPVTAADIVSQQETAPAPELPGITPAPGPAQAPAEPVKRRVGQRGPDKKPRRIVRAVGKPDFSSLPKPETVTVQGAQSEPEPVPVAVVPTVDPFRQNAEVAFDTSAGLLTMFFGPEWQPRSKDEREQVVCACEKFFRTKNMPDIPPGWALVIVAGCYAAPRFQAPPTKAKLAIVWFTVKGWFASCSGVGCIVGNLLPKSRHDSGWHLRAVAVGQDNAGASSVS